VPLPDHDLDAEIHRWASSEPVRDLVAEYGGVLPQAGTAELLAWLDDFSAVHWDFRGRHGLERHQVTAPEFSPARRELIGRVADALGFTGSAKPRHRTYEQILVLGGLVWTCSQRAEYAARLIAEGSVTTAEVTALGSFRPLGAAEGGTGYEVDALEAAFRSSFHDVETVETRSSPGEITHESWTVRSLRGPGGPRLTVLAAPSSEPGVRRANTPDAYHFWAQEAQLTVGARLLVITSPIYVPFQHCDALRTLALPYGFEIDTVGYDVSRASLPLPPGATGLDRYLQEIRSAIRSMRRLQTA
jgi:hypothetical protein